MRDKTISKFLCRIITLLVYIAIIFLLFVSALSEIYYEENAVTDLFKEYKKVLIICSAVIICIMLIILLIKYTYKEEKRLLIYRVLDVVVRIILTSPLTILVSYYFYSLTDFEWYIKFLFGVLTFIILNWLNRLALQESLGTSFVIRDEL